MCWSRQMGCSGQSMRGCVVFKGGVVCSGQSKCDVCEGVLFKAGIAFTSCGLSPNNSLQKTGLDPLLLDTQYRMHPLISQFPSACFYDARLKDGVNANDKPPPKGNHLDV
jgi:hypothetical protein